MTDSNRKYAIGPGMTISLPEGKSLAEPQATPSTANDDFDEDRETKLMHLARGNQFSNGDEDESNEDAAESDESDDDESEKVKVEHKIVTKIGMFEFNQNDPKMDTGMKLVRFGL